MGLGTTEVEGQWDLGENFWDEFWEVETSTVTSTIKEYPTQAVVISLEPFHVAIEEALYRHRPNLSGQIVARMVTLAALIHMYRLGSQYDGYRRVIGYIVESGETTCGAVHFMEGIENLLSEYLGQYLEYPPVKMYYRLIFLDNEDIVYVPIARNI